MNLDVELGTPVRRRSEKSGGPSRSPLGGQLLDTREAAAYLCMNAYTLEFWRTRKQHRGPTYLRLHAHAVRYRLADLDLFLEGRVVTPAREA